MQLQIDLQVRSVEVTELLNVVHERFSLLAESRGLTLVVTPTGQALTVQADAERASQILANLLSNAVKYTPPGGTIWVAAEQTAEGVMIRVQDDGPGLTLDDQRRIFERFYRTDLSRSRAAASGGGTGVGLTIARGLARAMDGDVTVAAGAVVGSVFTFTLPPGTST